MPTTEEVLDKGLEHHQAGRLREAESSYQEVLRLNPQHANALHLLGLVYHQQGKHAAAIESIRRALGVQPGAEVFWSNLGAVYQTLERYREAADAARQALRLNPQNGKAYFDLGCSLKSLGDLDEAAVNFRWALQINPNSPQTYMNLGNTLREQGKLNEAVCCYRKAVEIKPDFAEAYSNLGGALREQGKLDEAVCCHRKALEITADCAEALSNLGGTLRAQGKLDEAIDCHQKALEIKPDCAQVHKNLGQALLQKGDFQAGWAHYEWRWRTNSEIFKPRAFSQPSWDGRPREGGSVLLHAEQGLGDTIQFVRYAPLVRAQGCRVILECQKPLRTLLGSCPGIDLLVARGDELPPFDFHVPLLSLPHLLGTHAGNIPAEVPYLSAAENLVRHWQDQLRDCAGFKVGICWQGSPSYGGDRERSFTLSQFTALADVPGVHLICLQKGVGTDQLAGSRFPVRILGADFDEAHGAFMDTAAVMMNLDLVIAPDTAVAHLAGALGVPIWVALPFAPDWRWPLDREASPWYPTMRLFRQRRRSDWGDVFERMASLLRERLASQTPGSRSAAVAAEISPDLQALIDAWPTLPEAIKAGIVAMVKAAGNPPFARPA